MRERLYPCILRVRIPEDGDEAWVSSQLRQVVDTVPMALSEDDGDMGGLLIDAAVYYQHPEDDTCQDE